MRRADLRSRSVSTRHSSIATSRRRRRASAASASTSSPRKCGSGTSARFRRAPVRRRISTPAASTSGAATASTISSTRKRSSSSSTRRASGQYSVYREYTKLVNDQSRKLGTLRGLLRLQAGDAGAARRSRAGRVDRQALRDRRDVVRLDQPGSARDDRDRDEPARRPSRTRVKAARIRRANQPDRERRLAPERDQAGRVGAVRRHERVSRQRRRPADQDGAGGKAGRRRAAARAPRSIRGLRRCGTRRPA